MSKSELTVRATASVQEQVEKDMKVADPEPGRITAMLKEQVNENKDRKQVN